jgi:Ca2+-binding EF-hand superfamily protein
MVDWDGDGKLSREEVIRALQSQLRLDMQKIEAMIKDDNLWLRWDRDGSGFIESQELQSIQGFVSMPQFKGQEPDAIPNILHDRDAWFDFWDNDMGGTLDKEEVVRALVKTLRSAEPNNPALQEEMRSCLDMIWFLFDPDMDGSITKEEFLKVDGLAETVHAQLGLRNHTPRARY